MSGFPVFSKAKACQNTWTKFGIWQEFTRLVSNFGIFRNIKNEDIIFNLHALSVSLSGVTSSGKFSLPLLKQLVIESAKFVVALSVLLTFCLS